MLKEENPDLVVPTTQQVLKGHIIVYPQQPDSILMSLSPTIEEITAPICVIFVGSSPPSTEWL